MTISIFDKIWWTKYYSGSRELANVGITLQYVNQLKPIGSHISSNWDLPAYEIITERRKESPPNTHRHTTYIYTKEKRKPWNIYIVVYIQFLLYTILFPRQY